MRNNYFINERECRGAYEYTILVFSVFDTTEELEGWREERDIVCTVSRVTSVSCVHRERRVHTHTHIYTRYGNGSKIWYTNGIDSHKFPSTALLRLYGLRFCLRLEFQSRSIEVHVRFIYLIYFKKLSELY